VKAAAAALRPPLRLWARHAALALNPSPRMRRRLLVALAVALVLGGIYMLWFRNSAFVSVDQVSITGARGDDAERIRAALTGAAHDMTTLHVERDKLEQAVAGFSSVRTLEVSASFPHTLRIQIIERRAVAIAVSDSGRVPVSADGNVLQGVPTGGALPTIKLSQPPRSGRVEGAGVLRLVAVAGAAPPELTHRLTDVSVKAGKGIVAHLRHGPDVIFGDSGRIATKWLAAARVLADPSARGATYVDVRLPERPAAGGLPTGAQAAPATSTAPSTTPQTTAPAQAATPAGATPATTQAAPPATPQAQATPGTAPVTAAPTNPRP
jgi:cell division protein FtsQ